MAEKKYKDIKILIWQGQWHGGAEEITKALAEGFADVGFSVTYAVHDDSFNQELSQIRVPRLFPCKYVGYNNIAASLILRLRGQLNQYDIVLTHTAGFWKTKKNFFVFHEAGDLSQMGKKLPILSRLLFTPFYWTAIYALRKADLVMSASSKCKNFIARLKLKNYRMTANFVDTGVFKVNKNIESFQEFSLFFSGRADKIKNLKMLTKVCKKMKIKLKVAGIDCPNSPYVEYLGWLNVDQLVEHYNKASIFVLPSLYESFPISVLEALSCGTPVVISSPATPIEIRDYVQTFDPSSEESLIKAISYVRENYTEIKQKTLANAKKIRKEYNKDKVVKNEIEVIIDEYLRKIK